MKLFIGRGILLAWEGVLQATSARRMEGERETKVGMSFRGTVEVAVRIERGAGREEGRGGGGARGLRDLGVRLGRLQGGA